MIIKYYTNYIGKKEKYIDYENLPHIYINNHNYSFFIIEYFTNLLS